MRSLLTGLPVAKIARFSLAVYAAAITVTVVLAMTVGPFQGSVESWTRTRVLESSLKESERERERLKTERDRLLTTVKNLTGKLNELQQKNEP